MAHTLNGKLTGRAAATQIRDQKEEILQGQRVDLHSLRARLQKKLEDAITRCVELEGAKSFYPWYTPLDGSISFRVELIEKRIEELEAEQRYTIVDSLLGQEGARTFQVMDAAECLKTGEV